MNICINLHTEPINRQMEPRKKGRKTSNAPLAKENKQRTACEGKQATHCLRRK